MTITSKKTGNKPVKKGVDAGDLLKKNLQALRCLYDTAGITGASDGVPYPYLDGIIKILPGAFTRPDNVCCRITINDIVYKSGRYKKPGNTIAADIKVRGEKVGVIEIWRHGFSERVKSGHFTQQEVLLVNLFAECIGSIVSHRLAEAALRDSEEKFSKAFHASPAVISISDMKDGRLIDVNESFERYSGYSREEALNLTTVEAGRWPKAEERARFLKILKEKGSIRNLEISSRTKTGDLRLGLISADPVILGGRPCIISVTQDITDQKQSRDFLETLSNASPLAIYVIRDEKIKYANMQFQKITGYNHDELLDLNLLTLVATGDIDVVRSSNLYSMQEINPYPCEYRIISKKGRVKWVMQTVSPIHFQGKKALLGNIMDITERKYLERKVIEYEELNKLKGNLLATVSHELRTPLTAIKGYATMILDYSSKISMEEAMDYLKSIDSSADKLIKLVDELLDTSRMDSGLLELEKSPAGISGLINSLVNKASLRLNRYRIRAMLPVSLPTVKIDVVRVNQVLENLINHAAARSPEGSEILIAAGKKERDIEICVTDRGPGIPADELKNIFDRLHKTEREIHTAEDGIGLSLHICQRIIEAHGGRIWAESLPGQGNSIRFTLPI